MKLRTFLIGLLAIIFLSFSCEKKEDSTREEDEKELARLHAEIKILSESVPCEDASLWKFTAMGAKACGGPTEYIAYSSEINTEHFLELVDVYTKKMIAFNIKYHIVSDCAVVTPPDGVVCEDGKPKLVYDTQVKVN